MGTLIDAIRKEKKERAEQEKKQKTASLTPQLPSYSNVLAKNNDKYGLSAARTEKSFDVQPTEKLGLIDQIKRDKTAANSGSIVDRLNTWYKNSNNFMSNYQTRFSGLKGTYEDPYDSGISDWLTTVTEQKSRFDAEAESILSYLTTNRDLFDEEWLNATVTNLDYTRKQQNDILKHTEEINKHWSQWDSEDAYKRYQKISSIADMTAEQVKSYLNGTDPVAYVDDNGQDVTWETLYNSKYYKEFMDAEDFAENSQYKSTYRGGEKFNAWSGTYTDSGFDDIMYDYINRDETAKQRQTLTDLAYNASFLGLDNSERGEMTDDEIAIFNYLYATRGSDEAYAYIDYLTSDLNARQRETEEAYWKQFAKESPVGSSVFSVVTSPLKGLSYVGQIADFAQDGKIDQNEGYNKFSYSNSAIRDEVSNTIEQKWGGVGSFAYQTGMSMADFLFTTAITGGNEALSLAIMGSSAAADTVVASKDRGLEDWQAFTLGTAAGAIEAVTEKIGIDALFDAAKLGKGAVGYILSNTFAEGAEEGMSNILNLISDVLVAGDKSEWQKALNDYKSGGMNDKEAFKQVLVDHLLSLGLDVLGGAISGGIMGGGGAVVGAIGNTVQGKEYKNTYGADVGGTLAAKAVELSPNDKFAQKMQSKVVKGEELSNRQVGKLAQQNETAIRDQDVSALRESVSKRLTELGETGDVSKISEAIVKQKTGEKLSGAEKKTIESSKFGQRVATEEENVGKGTHTSAWAEEYYSNRAAAHEDYSKALKGKATSVAVKNAEGKTVKAEIQSVEADGEKATFTLSNGETVASDKVAFNTEDAKLVADIATERVSRVEGFTNEAATAMIKGYDGNVSAVEYAEAFSDAFELGANNEPSSKLVKAMNSGLSESVAHAAYVLGKESTKNVESVLKTDSKNGIINTNINESEAGYESGESLYLRNSGERAGGQNTEGQVSRMESSAGQAESRTEGSRLVADSEAARLVNEGQEVRVADLGILGGSTVHTVRLVDQANETATMKEARAAAEARGLKVKFFVGDNLTIKGKNGNWFAAQAYVLGEHVIVRADHPTLTSDQLMRHEIGHDKIAKGEVDIKAVREKLVETVGKEKVDEVAEAYAVAYIGSGLSTEEIWEECICDSLGDMNVFSGKNVKNDMLMEDMLPEINKAINETKSPAQTRGSPEGKASRETVPKRDKRLYAAGVYFLHKNFPPENESLSEAHRLAILWARNKHTVAGDQTLIFMNDVCYLVECFDDALNYYQVEDVLSKAEFDAIYKEIRKNGKVGQIKSILAAPNGYDSVNRQLSSIETGKSSADSDETQHGRESAEVVRLDREQAEGRGRSSSNGSRDSESSGEDRQKYSREIDSKYSSPEEAKASGRVSDAKFSIEFADDIANKQRQFAADGLSRISSEELEKAIADTAHMVNEMKPYANILPQDKVGKTLVKNGSYDVSVENTTVCIRTLAYNSFVDMVSEKVGRPLTQMESFLVSQKLYDIAKEPQCLYCYVSLDRKAFNEMVIRYTEQRDAALAAYEAAGKPQLPSSFNAEWTLFKEFLAGRKPTKNMWDRYVGWINAYNKGDRLVSLSDISTEAKRLELVEGGGDIASQVKDILKYAQSASWAKKQTQYVAYYDEILKLKPAVIRNLNNHYGMRWYSFSDYSGAFIVENMQQITDAAIRGLKGLSYTKDTDFAEIFAPTGMNINISVYAKKTADGGYEIDAKQSANIEEAIKLREQYPNVGIVVVATDKAGVEWALAQEWSDVVIPFHTVRTGADVAEFYNWEIFNAEQNDTVSDQNLWDAYTRDVGKKKASKMVYPSEHQNNRETYLSICEKRGLTPRFKSFLENPNYMKLVNETRQSEGQTSPLKAVYNLEAAERSFDKFVEKAGLTRKFETSHVGGATCRTTPIPRSALEKNPMTYPS